MKEIKLTQGKVALVDDEDYGWLNQWKWYAFNGHRDNKYAARDIRINKDNKKVIFMHRFILDCPWNMFVDHINHNGLDNRRSNIRLCSHRQNCFNKSPKRNGTSKYVGVYLDTRNLSKMWRSAIFMGVKKIHLGYFKTEEEAAAAYDRMAIKLYGEFANLNFK